MSEYEYVSINEQLDWKDAGTITAGVDVGAVGSRALVLLDGQHYAISQVATRGTEESAFRAINGVLNKTGLTLERIDFVVGTGRGRTQIPFAHKRITEIACGAAGAVSIWGPSVRTVLDAGGQSCKVIHCTGKGKVTAFLWNDKCAAGIGRSIEVFADLVKKELSEIGDIALKSERFQKLSDFCPVYAQSEAFDLMRSRVPLEEVIAGYHHAMARRISTLTSRAGLKKDFVIIGGLAKNQGITDLLEGDLKVSRLAPVPEWDPAAVVALGAALFADILNKRRQADA